MKNFKYIIAVITLFAVACNDEYMVYKGEALIQFGPEKSRIYSPTYNLLDTVKPFTFYYHPQTATQDTVYFDIYAIGKTTSEDRAFKLEQEIVKDTTNAEPGKHYKAFDDPTVATKYVIKAGTAYTRVPVVLLRNSALKTKNHVLKFKVVENENFKPGEIALTWRKINFSDKLSQPARWDASTSQYYFGKYSTVKHKFMIDQTGEKWDQDFIVYIYTDFALLTFWKSTVKTKLITYNAANPTNPLKDEFGELVVFP